MGLRVAISAIATAVALAGHATAQQLPNTPTWTTVTSSDRSTHRASELTTAQAGDRGRPSAPSGPPPSPGGGMSAPSAPRMRPGIAPPPAPAPPPGPGREHSRGAVPSPPPDGGRPPHDHDGGFVVYDPYWWGWGWPYAYWGWPYPYWDYPYYGYYPYDPYYAYGPQVYIEQAPAGYWYYCASARGYYPTVSTCPEPWIRVAPRPGEG